MKENGLMARLRILFTAPAGSFKCGFFGTLSKVWFVVTGKLPPFEVCCEEHDLAYEQIEDEEDRIWADAHFARCVERNGWRKLGIACHALIRRFGWLTFLGKKNKEERHE